MRNGEFPCFGFGGNTSIVKGKNSEVMGFMLLHDVMIFVNGQEGES
jgi:hypothetical protein